MGGVERQMDRRAELMFRFDQIDHDQNGTLEIGELQAVFGESSEEFLSFCDSAKSVQDLDNKLTMEEFVVGILSNVDADTTDDEFSERAKSGRDLAGCLGLS